VEMLRSALQVFESVTVANDHAITNKSSWAKLTYLFVGLALLAYVVLTVFLYCFSISRP
jgi:hypothetical protein